MTSRTPYNGESPSRFCAADLHADCQERMFRFCTCECHLPADVVIKEPEVPRRLHDPLAPAPTHIRGWQHMQWD